MAKKKTDFKKQNIHTFKATVKANRRGYAFLIPEGFAEREHDYFVPQKKLCGALDGDEVLAARVEGTRDEAYVVKILCRGRKVAIGYFEKDARGGRVLCDDEAFLKSVYIPLSLCGGAKTGDKVVAEITSYPKDKPVGGKIVEVLGEAGELFCEELAIIKSHSLLCDFSDEAKACAREVAKSAVEIDTRRDLTKLFTVTIDGEDTRDMDDAVSLEIENGAYKLGVHIADVSRYVLPFGVLDKQAYERGTSVYFPDRVYPMLPKEVSCGACSLNEGEPKYALSCLMTFDKDGKKLDAEFCESVIKSDRKLSYTQVDGILAGGAKDEKLCRTLINMADLARTLQCARGERGEVDLDIEEAHIYLDENGEIVIPAAVRTVSHNIIEQFMIAANESAAEFLEGRKLPCLYRVHEPPVPEKTAALYSFLRGLGVKTYGSFEEPAPMDFKKILDFAEGKPYAEVVKKVMLRSMQKARYCEQNYGHFALASEAYCHFTSPIRRYPDLFVHRVIKCALAGDEPKAVKKYAPLAHKAGIDCSEKERRAELAERDVDDLYKLFYMLKHIGEQFDAIVSGVIESGIFARLDNTIEGMIRLESLPQDKYFFYEDKLLLKGLRHSYKMGDRIRVLVAGCDLPTRRVQFTLV